MTVERNVISGNSSAGVSISGTATTENAILGNYIGLDGAGAAALSNAADGIAIAGSPGNTIGGAAAGDANVISGNGAVGIYLFNAGANGNLIEGNLVGTNAAGTAGIGNHTDGVSVSIGLTGNTVGGTVAGAGNLISGNSIFGIGLNGSSTLVLGNTVGLDIAGTYAIPNFNYGIVVGGPNNTIGGTVSAPATSFRETPRPPPSSCKHPER